MKLIRAARFAGITFLVTILYGVFVLQTALSPANQWEVRYQWLADNVALWMLGGWLGLLAIFAWMVYLVTLMYTYIPMHRVATMLQSGLMVLSAVFLVGGVVLWMNLLPQAVDSQWAAFVDRLALAFSGAGLFMAGGLIIWIAVDLGQLGKLPWSWLLPGIVAGFCALPSPFLLPQTILLLPAAVIFSVWAILFGVRHTLPAAYPEMTAGFHR